MNNKLKLFSADKKKARGVTGGKDVVERFAPDLYDLYSGVGVKDILSKVEELQPEIVLISSLFPEDDLEATAQMIREIKRLDPNGTVFVRLGQVDDEEEATELFMESGAYKCYPDPVIMNSLFHDFYVSQNLEE